MQKDVIRPFLEDEVGALCQDCHSKNTVIKEQTVEFADRDGNRGAKVTWFTCLALELHI